MTTGFVPHTTHAELHDHHRLVAWLWAIQFGLAALYLFTGIMKWAMPADQLAAMTHLPALFMRGIATAEILGALGLLLPGLYGVARWLTPLAAVSFQAGGSFARVRETAIMIPMPATIRQAMIT